MPTVTVKITEEDKRLIFEAAHIKRFTMSAFIRNVCVTESARIVKEDKQ